jgi:acyl-CoA thioesterase-1
MRIPPNYGQRYSELFANQYTHIATDLNVALVPFLLQGIAGQLGMMQTDGIHPTKSAQPIMVQSVWQALEPLL